MYLKLQPALLATGHPQYKGMLTNLMGAADFQEEQREKERT